MNPKLNEISSFFKTEYPLNKDGLKELFDLFSVIEIKKNVQILTANAEERQLRFLNKGIIREYYSSYDKETNINFYTKPQFITDLSSFINDSKSSWAIFS